MHGKEQQQIRAENDAMFKFVGFAGFWPFEVNGYLPLSLSTTFCQKKSNWYANLFAIYFGNTFCNARACINISVGFSPGTVRDSHWHLAIWHIQNTNYWRILLCVLPAHLSWHIPGYPLIFWLCLPTVSWKENSSESETGVLFGMENMRLNFVPVPEFGTGTYSFSEIYWNLSQKKEGPIIWSWN
jgi:hypothetical protein